MLQNCSKKIPAKDPEMKSDCWGLKRTYPCWKVLLLSCKHDLLLIQWLRMYKARKHQGCQMVNFQNKNPKLGPFGRALDWKMLIYFVASWNILQTFGIYYDHLVYFVHLSGFGIMYQEKSGNPGKHMYKARNNIPSLAEFYLKLECVCVGGAFSNNQWSSILPQVEVCCHLVTTT
jgi:hypothetical protein